MMYAELYQYFILHKRLSLPGIGTFLLHRKPAETDFPNRQVKPPLYTAVFSDETGIASKNFFHWLGHALGVSDRNAVIRFNDFAFDMKKQIADGTVINWNGLGVLNKGLAGEIKFTAASFISEKPVAAEKVIREKAEHFVRVGEDEKTSVEMTAMLNKPAVARSYWWVSALILGVLSIAFIGWYISQHGMEPSSFTNSTKLVPMETTLP
ncbi:MAG: hypothetical protein AAB221_03400 [Bacteroidota bacterium]